MDIRTSKFIVASACMITLMVTLVAYFGVSRLNDSAPKAGNLDEPPAYRRARYEQLGDRSIVEEKLSKRRLRELLDDRTRAFRDRSAELRQTQLAYEKLQSQFADLDAQFVRLKSDSNENTTLLVDLVAQINERSTSAQESEIQPPEMQLIDEDDDTNSQDAELTLVQWQLDMANERIRELENSVLQEMLRSSEATRAIVDSGMVAVPTLTELLTDGNSDVRAWAAEVLGRIGPTALAATDNLMQAMSDPDRTVRDAAATALDRIEGRP